MNGTLASSLNSSENSTIFSSQTDYFLQIGFLIGCMIVGLAFNLMFVVTFRKSRSIYRRSLYCLYMNLVCIFLIDIFFNQSFTLVSAINRSWIFSSTVCIAQAFGINIVDISLSLTLFMLGIDRIIAVQANIKDNAKLAKGLKVESVALSVVCFWLVSICFSVPIVTDPSKSRYFSDSRLCLPVFDSNFVYKISTLVITLAAPLTCSAGIYFYIVSVWSQHRRSITSHRLSLPLQIEKELQSALLCFILLVVWLLLVGPHFVWLYASTLPRDNYCIAFTWMRCYYCCIPVALALLFKKSFRVTVCTKHVTSRLSEPGNSSSININGDSNGNIFSQTTVSTNLAFSRTPNQVDDFSDSHSLSLSYSSSAVSCKTDQITENMPTLIPTEFGLHVHYESQGAGGDHNNENFLFGTLCDVNEADTSDATSLASNFSVYGNGKLNKSIAEFELPANVSAFYNHEVKKVKRNNSRATALQSLESAFETPTEPEYETTTPEQNVNSIQSIPRRKRRRKLLFQDEVLPELSVKSDVNYESSFDESDAEKISSTNV